MIEKTRHYGEILFTVLNRRGTDMQRAFVEKGSWRVAASATCDAAQQTMATLRVSALAGVAVLGLMMAPDLKQEPPHRAASVVIVSTAPDIIPAKSLERVPGHETAESGDVTSTAPTRRWRSQADPHGSQSQVIITPKPAVHAAIEVVDAMTLRAGEMVVRLAGLAPPDGKTACRRLDGLVVSCADRAVSYLQLLVKGRSVACARAGVSPDGVEKGQCRIGESDIAEQMVRQGWARAEAQPEERFLVAEAAARKQKLGIWR
jgi:endonuclease YncB( thermonuclease family)